MKNTSRPHPHKSAFTLIELLVVIAIIALLISLIVPVTSNALEKARRSACASNLRTLAQGLVVYAADHKGNFPNYQPNSNSWPWAAEWALKHSDFFEDYVSNENAYYCPTDLNNTSPASEAKRARTYFPEENGPRPAWRKNISYNYFYGGSAWDPERIFTGFNERGGYQNIADIPDPASSTMIADLMLLGRNVPSSLDISTGSDWNHRNGTMAKSGGNLGYADGHVAWFSLKNGLPDEFATRSNSRVYVNQQSGK
ncbi:type II secretion system protein [Kiritimatiellota bacterium B12222]|nr:type II secretion system protein [Kiritimatiellota bacterium B12222]